MQNLPKPYSPIDYLSIKNHQEFEAMALMAFNYQYHTNPIYQSFCRNLGTFPERIKDSTMIPFLPIELFKNHEIISGDGKPALIFKSSGTTGANQSKHYVLEPDIYHITLTNGFTRIFGDPADYSFLALLPGYMDRPDSSLIYMVNELMKSSKTDHNGFYKEATPEFIQSIQHNQQNQIPTILFGVSFSLLNLAENAPINMHGISIIETGGMKGSRDELTRKELHDILKKQLNVDTIYSEYGMTELLSQAYSQGSEQFELPPWMQVYIREPNDPQAFLNENKVGGINVIDLANVDSCCFISTQDLGKKTSPNTFEVLGRFDNSDIRGCNLLYF